MLVPEILVANCLLLLIILLCQCKNHLEKKRVLEPTTVEKLFSASFFLSKEEN